MARYHLNPKTGVPGPCKAMLSCPFGDMEEDHYSTPEEARVAYERSMGGAFGSAPTASEVLAVAPYPAWLTEELRQSIPRAADGTSFEDNWLGYFAPLASSPIEPTEEAVRRQLGINSFGRLRGLSVVRMEEDRFDPYEDEEGTYLEQGLHPVDSEGKEDLPLVARVYTRNGGGNRECWCENGSHPDGPCTAVTTDGLLAHPAHLHDWDDSFDSTYATFLFRLDETPELMAAVRGEKEQARQVSAKRLHRAILAGEESPLAVLPENPKTAERIQQKGRKLVELQAKWRAEDEKLTKTGDPQRIELPPAHLVGDFDAALKTPLSQWSEDQVAAVSRAVGGANARQAVVFKENYGKYRAAFEAEENAIGAIADARNLPSDSKLLAHMGGLERLEKDRSWATHKRKRAEEPLRRTYRRLQKFDSYRRNTEKVSKELLALRAAAHWPGLASRMPSVFASPQE